MVRRGFECGVIAPAVNQLVHIFSRVLNSHSHTKSLGYHLEAVLVERGNGVACGVSDCQYCVGAGKNIFRAALNIFNRGELAVRTNKACEFCSENKLSTVLDYLASDIFNYLAELVRTEMCGRGI